MSTKLFGLLIGGLLVLACLLGAVLASQSALEAPAIVNARAEREQAAAREAQARAAAVAQAQPQIALGVQVLAVGVPGAVVLAALFGALAFGRWAFLNAAVLRPRNGELPLVVTQGGGRTSIIDAGRAIGPLTTVTDAGKLTSPKFSEAALAQVAQSAQAAGVMVAALHADARTGEPLAEKIKSAASGLAGLMPVPTFGTPPADTTDNGKDNVRLVYVRGGKSEAQKDLDELREFLEQGAGVRGFARRSWLGFKFASGRECSRARYDDLIAKCAKAEVLTADGKGWRMACDVGEALQCFGLAAGHS